ncbi:hypothetical protein GOP47_0009689 [Adiantum capillus-veneris]|uniref:Uncharacterized protein n=1 Tax=Adiantum capillus-veneris TaxID=13818 RepID=A0A9D4UX15_ADICA|nr:hypothetical protein GOP47_0009689 [Adiantum capillus-veneris]
MASYCRLQSSPPCCHLSVKKGYGGLQRTPPSLSVRCEGSPSQPVRNVALNAIAAPAEFSQRSSKIADVLGGLSVLYGEVGEERREAAECVQKTSEENGRSAEDYGRRALLFERSGKMAASSKLKGDRLLEELELLHSDILQWDEGRSAEDYRRRAELFGKSAEILGGKFCDEAVS